MSNLEEPSGPALAIQHTGQVLPLGQEPVTIGRAEDNVLILDDPQVDEHQASIAWQAETGAYLIEDLGSSGGTYVNEVPVEAPQPLRHGDVIRVGNTILDARLEPAEAYPEVVLPPLPPEEAESAAKSRTPLLAGIAIVVVAGIAILCLAGLAALVLSGGKGGPVVAIQSPADGAQIAAGSEIILQATASGVDDIVLVELSVDGALVASATSPDPARGASSLTVRKAWVFPEAGSYEISAVAYTAGKNTSRPASVRVEAVAREAGVTPGPSSTPTAAGAEPTATPLPTLTATPEPGETVPPPPQIEYFQASPASVTAGGCATLQWGTVAGADEARIEPEVGGVGTPGSSQVCPAETTTYVLTATGPGGETQASTTVTVIGGLPDLIVESISFVPNPPLAGQDNEVQIAFRNVGAGPAGAFNWQWDAGQEGVLSGRIYGLNAGEGKVETVLWNPSQGYASLSTEARADVDDEVKESDKGNNRLRINVQVAEAPSEPETVNIESNGSLDGYWTNRGAGDTSGDIYIGNGDIVTPTGELVSRGFLSFDLASIPAGATIQAVELRFYQKTVQGSPYGKLGSLLLEPVYYGSSLGDAAFDAPTIGTLPLASLTAPGSWYTVSDSSLVSWVQAAQAGGQAQFQLRLRFERETDGDGEQDYAAIEPGGAIFGNKPAVVITYLP